MPDSLTTDPDRLQWLISATPALQDLLEATGDLATLRSVLAVHERCEAEAWHPTRAPTLQGEPDKAANGPAPAVQQAMVHAVESGERVVLTLDIHGETVRHLCRVQWPAVRECATVFAVEPLVPGPEPRTLVRTGDGVTHMPLVIAVTPVALAPERETMWRLPPASGGRTYSVHRTARGWAAMEVHETGESECEPQSTEGEAHIDAWEMALDDKESECARMALAIDDFWVALGAQRGQTHEQVVGMIATLGSERDQAIRDADEFAQSAIKQRARAAGARDLCTAITEAIDTLTELDSPVADEVIGLLTRALTRHHASEPTTYPEPDREGWYWASYNGGQWQAVQVDSCEGEFLVWAAGDERESSLTRWTWGPRIDPPRNAASRAEVDAP
jgi:hypothetical protein